MSKISKENLEILTLVKMGYKRNRLNENKFWKFENYPQCPEINSNKILNTIHKNYIGLTSMLQGFQKCIA